MPSSFAAARDFAKSYPRGSKLASSAFQADPGPDPFKPGEVTPAATVVKFAQLVLGEGSRRRREKMLDAQARMAAQHQALVDQVLAQKADPNYMSPSERETKRYHDWQMTKPPAAPQPPATMDVTPELAGAVGHGVVAGPQDPRVVTAAGAATGREHTDQRARDAAARVQQRRSKVAEARFGIAQIKEGRDRALVESDQTASDYFDMLHKRAKTNPAWFKSDSLQKSARDSIGLTPGAESPSDIVAMRNAFLAKYRRIAGMAYDKKVAAKRAQWNSIIEAEAGLPDDVTAPEADPEADLEWNGSEFVPATKK